MEIVVGLIGIGFVLWSWLARVPDEPRRPSAPMGVFWGSLAGFTSTIIQVGAPPYQVHILPQRLDKFTLIGTTVIFFGLVNVMKVVPYFALGQFSTATLGTSLLLLPLAIAHQLSRPLARPPHAGRAVLQDRLRPGVRHLHRADLAGGARLMEELIGWIARPPFARLDEPHARHAMAQSPYDTDLDRNPANFQPLTPLSFLERAASVFPDQTAIIHGPLRRSYREFYARTRRLASALQQRGIGRGDTVSAVLANTPAMLECHYGVPMSGAVLNTINTRLDAAVIAFQFDHAETKVLITDREFSKVVKEALRLAKVKPLVIDYDDPEYRRRGRAARHDRIRGFHRRRRSGFRLAACRTTNGTRSRSTTRRAPPAIPRAWSITTAAPTCWRSATC